VNTFQGLANSGTVAQDKTMNGPPILIDNAATIFAGNLQDATGGSSCYWSPSNTEALAVAGAIATGQTAFPTGLHDPQCFYVGCSAGGGNCTQIVLRTSMPLNTNPGNSTTPANNMAPAFLLERQRSPTAPAAVQIP
jgi:hypothetical protein